MNERPVEELLAQLGNAPVPTQDTTSEAAHLARERVVGSIETALRQVAQSRARRRPFGRSLLMMSAAAVVALGVMSATAAVALGVPFPWQEAAPPQNPAMPAAPPTPSDVGRAPLVVAPAAATPAVVAAGDVREIRGTVVVRHDGRDVLAAPNDTVGLTWGDAVSTAPQSHARVLLASGISLDVDDAAKVDLRGPGEMDLLVAGRATIHVPQDGSFLARTAGDEVASHGALFAVSARVSDASGAAITVFSGEVTLRHAGTEIVLREGASWPDPASSAAAPRISRKEAAGAVSTLEAQNELLRRALEARRGGDDRRALRALDDLLARYPSSPLAPEAHVERFRALEHAGQHGAAEAEARRYLAKYPEGTGRAEASALVAQ